MIGFCLPFLGSTYISPIFLCVDIISALGTNLGSASSVQIFYPLLWPGMENDTMDGFYMTKKINILDGALLVTSETIPQMLWQKEKLKPPVQ